jgi:sugar/nucleoside kinase (ribokinase family)
MSTYDILVVGGAGIDTIVRVPDLQLPVADSVHVPPIRDYVAHTGNGVVLACHALGLRCKFIDFIGNDAQGAAILQRYKEAKLDFSRIVEPSGTRRSVNLVDPQGRRMSLYDGRHPEDVRMPAAFYLPYLDRRATRTFPSWAGWPTCLTMRACAAPPCRRICTTGTASTRTTRSSPCAPTWSSSARRHWASAGHRHAGHRGTRPRARRHRHGGRRWRLPAGTRQRRGPPLPCAQLDLPVVDTNGAGDSFVAAFLHAWLAGAGIDAAMRRGAIAGAFACAQHGTHERFIGREELHDLYQDGTSL